MLCKNSAERRYSTFNSQYHVIDSLGEGMTSKVFLCRCLKDPEKLFALKLIREDFLMKETNPLQIVQ